MIFLSKLIIRMKQQVKISLSLQARRARKVQNTDFDRRCEILLLTDNLHLAPGTLMQL